MKRDPDGPLARGTAPGHNEGPALTSSFSGADDGTRTRDPHLGKVAGAAFVTCVLAFIYPVTCTFAFSCDGVVSHRCAVVHGTPTGPLSPSADDGQTGEQASRSDTPSRYEVVYEMDPPTGPQSGQCSPAQTSEAQTREPCDPPE
jgi:hypothetical protein